MEEKTKSNEHVIFVNKQPTKVSEDKLTGREVLEKAGLKPDDYDLYLVQGQTTHQIGPDQTVDIKNGLHFNAIPRSVPYG